MSEQECAACAFGNGCYTHDEPAVADELRRRARARHETHAAKIESLRARAEQALGWERGSSGGFSLPALREWVRGLDADLYAEMTECIDSGRHWLQPPSADVSKGGV